MARGRLLFAFFKCLNRDRPRSHVDPALTRLPERRPFLLHLIAYQPELAVLRELRDFLIERSIFEMKQQVIDNQASLFVILPVPLLLDNLRQFSVGHSLPIEISQDQKTKRHTFDVVYRNLRSTDTAHVEDYSPNRNECDNSSTEEVHRLRTWPAMGCRPRAIS